MDSQYIKTLLSRYGLKPNFTYGQNFLIDEVVLEDMVDASGISKEDLVLEIGPGIGNLTRKLCERAGFVLSVEKDPKFQPILYNIKKDFRDNFRYEIFDALEFDYQDFLENYTRHEISELKTNDTNSGHSGEVRKLVSPYKVVANIPYYITGKILEMFMTSKNKPSSITVLTQKEVAERVVAKAGGMSLLSISVQLYGEPKIISIVPARSFYPAPKVDSAVLKIDLFEKPKYEIEDEKKFFKVLKACFSGKRKQIHNTLSGNFGLPKEKVLEVLSELSIDPKIRPQELEIEQWVELVKKISSN